MVDHSSASEHNDFTRCLSLFDSAFPQILSLLGMPAPTQLSPDTFYYSLDKARERLGNWSSVAARFNYNEQEMASFLAALRTLNKWLGRNTDGQPADRNLTIAALRFLWQLEYLREKQPQLTYSTTLHNEGEEKQLRSLQQVRALELTIRSLINEAYNNQQALLEHLNKLFGQERVKKWLNVADRDDVLSGTLFSELASLFIDKDEYPIHYSPLYQYTPLLSFVNDKRRTLNTFLDDIRVIRNRLAHHKRVTSVQTTLMNYYYQEITEPVQEAFDEGRVKVNPDRFFDDSNAEVAHYFEQTAQKIEDLGGDVQEIKDDLVAQAQDIGKIKIDTRIIRNRVAWVLGGIVVIIVGSVLTFGTSTKTLVNTESIRSDLGEVGKTVAGAKKETSNDPRKELANIGIAWDEKNLRAAIDRGDTQVVNLFLAGGMRWKLYYAEAALQEDRQETLNALLQSASLMDEKNGCLRMAGKLRQQADHNGTLTPIQIRYLKTFCSSAKDVQGIKAELDRALNFEKAQKKAYDEEMAKNEPAGRCERRLMADNARELLADAAQFSLQRPTTYSLHDVLLKELNTRLMFGTLNEAELKSLVKNYCVKQENHEPNIAIGDNWSRSQRVIYNVVK